MAQKLLNIICVSVIYKSKTFRMIGGMMYKTYVFRNCCMWTMLIGKNKIFI